jgi:DNA-binding IclR family transcriptional regulator
MLLSPRAIVEIARIHRSTTHRAINTVMRRGCVEQLPKVSEYTLKVTLLALAHVATQEQSIL